MEYITSTSVFFFCSVEIKFSTRRKHKKKNTGEKIIVALGTRNVQLRLPFFGEELGSLWPDRIRFLQRFAND